MLRQLDILDAKFICLVRILIRFSTVIRYGITTDLIGHTRSF